MHDLKLQTTSDFNIYFRIIKAQDLKLQTTFNIWIYYVNQALYMTWETTNYIGFSSDIFKKSKIPRPKLQTTLEFQEIIFKISNLDNQNYKLHQNFACL